MEIKNKELWVNKILPMLYLFSVAAVCTYLVIRARSWVMLFTDRDPVLLLVLLAVGYFAICCIGGKKYLVAKTKVFTYIYGVATFLFIYLSMSVITADLVQLILFAAIKDENLRTEIFEAAGWICAAFVVICAVIGIIGTRRLKIITHKINIEGMNGKCRMVLLSDLHIGFYVGAQHIRKTVDKVNALHPDCVVIAGDIINAGNTRECPEIDKAAAELAKLSSKLGAFAVTGNHDPDSGDADFVQFLQDADITLLDDEVYKTDRFALIGRKTCTQQRKELCTLKEQCGNLPIVVIDHDPLGARQACRENADLVLCGHTHKGQVFPLGLFCRLLYSKGEFWGLSKKGKTNIMVSAGTGYFSMPMRIGSSCEINCLELS